MPSLGSKKKENLSRMDRQTEDLPQLSNEMQLSIMNKVKSGELSIEDALDQAKKDRKELLKQKTLGDEEQQCVQYNFCVLKHNRYRWQKRVLQFDLNTKMLCSIEKGIIKRQFSFSTVKSCDDGAGSRFSISFKGHHDYELEATSLEDKHKIIQLVNQIIYGNIYTDHKVGNAETPEQPQPSQSLREGVLLLHRGGLASFKWVKYEVQLHPGQLILVPFRLRGTAQDEATSSVSTVIHLSDGDTTVQKPPSPDTFTLITHKNQYQFRVPLPDQTTAPGAIQTERDAWVRAIGKLCSEWKRKSLGEQAFVEAKVLRDIRIDEDEEDTNTDPESSGESEDPTPVGGDGDEGQKSDSAEDLKPVPKPRSNLKDDLQAPGPDVLPPEPSATVSSPTSPQPSATVSSPTSPQPSPTVSSPTSPQPSPTVSSTAQDALTPSAPESPTRESNSSAVKAPPPPSIPAPPPLPFPLNLFASKPRTKAFHWDEVNPEKIAKSFWIREGTRRIEIDTTRLYEQFAVKDVPTFEASEQSNAQHIMLNQKIAHNFNIFLKSFPVQPGELKDKLFIIKEGDGGLSDEHITSLRRYVPTVDDVEKYKSHKGPVSELHIVDQYMMEMCNIPYLSTQLDLLLTLRELPNSMNDLQPLINQKIRMCTQLNNCRSFVCVLEYILAIGNYLNENSRKGKAKGFRLSSLTKLSELRGRDKKFTLLHALVEQIVLREPYLVAFTQELTEFETVPGASIKGLTAEIDVLKNELQKVIQYSKTSKKRNAGVQPQSFSKDLKMATEKYSADLSALRKMCEEMKKLYSVTLVKFGEPADQDSQDFFGLISQFVHDFRSVQDEMI